MKLNYKIIFYFLGLLLSFNGGFMLLASLMSFLYKDGVTFQIAVAGLIALTLGVLVMLITRSSSKEMGKREGYIVVTFGWLVMALSGTIPYLLTGSIPNFSNAFLSSDTVIFFPPFKFLLK